jgi:hypothetical protein
MALRLHHCAARDRSLARELKILDTLLPIVGGAEVMRKLGGNLRCALAPRRLYPIGDAAMQLDALARTSPLVQHVEVERVEKGITPCDGGVGPFGRASRSNELFLARESAAALLYLAD